MGLYLNPGNGMFQDTLNGDFYVDKTGLASFLNGRMGTPQKFVCVSRPRRFGKSVDADMLVAYYGRGADSRGQFEGLAVSRDASFDEHLNAHDVIKIDVQRMIRRGEGGLPAVCGTIAEQVIPELAAAWPGAVPGGCRDLPLALELAARAKGSGFVFVVDEWGCVMRLAEDDDAAQRAYLDFLRDLFKGAPYVEAAYMTGILPIRKYGQHSALNLFREFSMTRPDELADGKGYADVAFVPKPGSPLPPMVVELKWDKPADAALAQIRARRYPDALAGLSGECVLAGVTYDPDTKRHECAIERVEL